MGKVQTPFPAVTDGFEFVNFFEFKLPVKFELPLAGKIDLDQVILSLCGGMCKTCPSGPPGRCLRFTGLEMEKNPENQFSRTWILARG